MDNVSSEWLVENLRVELSDLAIERTRGQVENWHRKRLVNVEGLRGPLLAHEDLFGCSLQLKLTCFMFGNIELLEGCSKSRLVEMCCQHRLIANSFGKHI